jgi:hydantoinase/carbamoylase family amidase
VTASGNGSAQLVLERCAALGGISEEPGRLTRRFATEALARAGEEVAGWMREAGMAVRSDNAGNVIGRYDAEVAGAPTLLLGSHLDTVRDAGRYDGPLGVLAGIAVVERLAARGEPPAFAVEVVGFADEEGLRFGTAYLGSKVVAGHFDLECLQLTDEDGVTMAEAITAAGGDPGALAGDAWSGAGLLGYWELHIEQGPVLEAEGLPVGVVSAIAGQSRIRVTLSGEAGHAGTVPMELRRDALSGAAELVLAAEAAARGEQGLVATVGELAVAPGAANVVPGGVTLSLDVRHADDDARQRGCAVLRARAEAIAAERRLGIEWRVLQETAAVATSPELTGLLEQAIAEQGLPARRLTSGAGHDAVVMAGLAPVAMLFVRCAGGVSHNPAESVAEDDVAVALDVLSRAVDLLASA